MNLIGVTYRNVGEALIGAEMTQRQEITQVQQSLGDIAQNPGT